MNQTLALGLLILGFFASRQIGSADSLAFDITPITFPDATSTRAIGINDSGQIVGWYDDASGHTHGFLDTNGQFSTIDFPGSPFTEASGINNRGQIVGYFGPGFVFLYSNDTFTTIPLPGSGVGYENYTVGINDLDQIVGGYTLGEKDYAFEYSNGLLTSITNSQFGPHGGAAANGINNSGTIVGALYAGTSDDQPWFWDNAFQAGEQIPDPSLGVATGINNRGQILVNSSGSAFLFDRNSGVSMSLNLSFGLGINDSDQIVGTFGLATPVPEPVSVLMFVSGFIAIWMCARVARTHPNLRCKQNTNRCRQEWRHCRARAPLHVSELKPHRELDQT